MFIYDQIQWLQDTKQNDPITFWYLITITLGSTLFYIDISTTPIETVNLHTYIPIVFACIVYLIYDKSYKNKGEREEYANSK